MSKHTETFAKDFGRKLALRRESMGFTQTEFARVLGTTQQLISRYEQNKTIPSLPMLVNMARVLRVTVDFLVRDDVAEAPALTLTDEEKLVLKLAEVIGVDEAIRRLTRADGGGSGGPEGTPSGGPVVGRVSDVRRHVPPKAR